MEVIKSNKSRHYHIGIIAMLSIVVILILQPYGLVVLAQKSDSLESSPAALKSEDESVSDTEKKKIFDSKNDSANKSQIHPFVKDMNECGKCHDVRKMLDSEASYIVFAENSATIQTLNCKGCHPQNLGDHPILVRPMFPVPKDLPLSKRGEVTCMTCHNTHYVRYSDRPWSPRSYQTKIFDYVNKKKEFKTYFLRRNNSKKELCIACHTGVRHQRAF